MPSTTLKLLTAAAATAALTTGATTALAQDPAAPTVITVASATQLKAGAIAPFDAPGVKAIRRGKTIPSGYVLVGRKVTIAGGAQSAWAAGRLTCPAGKTLRTMGAAGKVYPQPGGTGYLGRRSFRVMFEGTPKPGETVTGTVYGVCR